MTLKDDVDLVNQFRLVSEGGSAWRQADMVRELLVEIAVFLRNGETSQALASLVARMARHEHDGMLKAFMEEA